MFVHFLSKTEDLAFPTYYLNCLSLCWNETKKLVTSFSFWLLKLSIHIDFSIECKSAILELLKLL